MPSITFDSKYSHIQETLFSYIVKRKTESITVFSLFISGVKLPWLSYGFRDYNLSSS